MDYPDIFHLDKSIGFLSIAEMLGNSRQNGMWINAVDERGDSPMHIAAKYKDIDLMFTMLKSFYRPNIQNNQGNTVLHLVIENFISHKKIDDQTASISSFKAICNLATTSTYFNKKHRLIRALISKGTDLNIKNNQGLSPIHLAAKYCYIDVLKIFKSKDADFKVPTSNGETLLHLVCKNMSTLKDTPSEIEIMDYLVTNGSDVNAMDKEGYIPLHYAVWRCSIKGVERLVKLGSDIYSRTHKQQFTPLHLASIVSTPSVVQFLVSFGADVNTKDSSGKTPLHLVSIRSCRNDVMELLLSSGAQVDVLDHKGCLPLDYVLENQNIDGLERLLEYGADIIDTKSFQRIPVDQILKRKSLEIYVLKHLTRLKAADLHVDSDYDDYLEKECYRTYRQTCLVEVKKLKKFTIDDTGVSLYDLLHMESMYEKLQYAFVQDILPEIRSDFPNYCGVLKASIHEVIKKQSLYQLAKVAFYQLIRRKLTDFIIERIFSHLNDKHLILVIESMESR